MAKRVLIVDDETDVARLLSFNLADAGFEAEVARSGEGALAMAAEFRPHVVVLDLMLPDLSGYEVCRRLREDPALAEVAVLMLTARGDEADRIVGLESGADDYVVKPFSVREVVLRVQALAKRTADRSGVGDNTPPPDAPTQLLRARELEVDLRTHEVRYAGEQLSLRPLEFKLLVTLLGEPGRVFSRAELLAEVWGIRDASSTRTVDVHIKRLRSNLGRAADLIETVHGFGYRATRPEGGKR
ncbi:MAG TPA: response regulator [Kofleriaceae bacterium]|jgi:two-component system phosphate regulon response regulator PhoB